MDQQKAIELLNYLQTQPNNFEIIKSKLEQCNQAIIWAQSLQKWDLVIAFTRILSYHFEFSHPLSKYLAEQKSKNISKDLHDIWEQAKNFAEQGLIAAQKIGDQEKQFGFLVDLFRLSMRLNDTDMSLEYLKQELDLVEPNVGGGIARDFYLLGNKSSELGDFVIARTSYQLSLKIYQELNNIYAIAEVLPFLIINETRRTKKVGHSAKQVSNDLESILNTLWELKDMFQQEANTNTSSHQQPPGVLFNRLEDVLHRLNAL